MTNLLLASCITTVLRLWSLESIRQKVFGFVPRLPRWAQWAAPLVLSMLAAAGQGWLDGLRGEPLLEATLLAGGQIGAEAIAIWHSVKRIIPQVNPKATVVSLLLLVGCAGSFEEAKLAGQQDRRLGATIQPSRCAALESQRAWGHAVSIGAASLAGVSGLSTVKVDDQDRELRYGLAVGSVGAAASAVGAEAYAQSAGVAWVRGCGQ